MTLTNTAGQVLGADRKPATGLESFNNAGRMLDDAMLAGNLLTDVCHTAAKSWWTDKDGNDIRLNPLCFANKLLLIVTEVAEACEGDRKTLMDDHLPSYPMRSVELADAAIRIFDLAGAYNIPLGEIIAAKLLYNGKRPDHKRENRFAEGGNGKAY